MKDFELKAEIENAAIVVKDLGLIPYGEAWALQKRLFENLVASKRLGNGNGREYLLFAEHLPVVTLGRRAKENNLLFPEEIMKQKGVDVQKIERGGDVTYHGPEQLVVYPILDLDRHKLGVKDYVNLLEESVIRLLDRYGIAGERVEGATGVWIGKNTTAERKICAIGIKCSRFCTMHGLALNVNTDLRGFSLINPCGFTDKGVTSIEKELGERVDLAKVKNQFSEIFLSLILTL